MRKSKKYVQPSISIVQIESEPLLAAVSGGTAPSVKADVDGDDLEYGGDTEPGQTYTPW